MNNRNLLDLMLKTTRITIEKNRTAYHYYEPYFGLISEYLASLNLKLDFHITFSSSRKHQIATINTSTFVVYDQYLGQSFNLLNRLYFENVDSFNSIIYAHKVAAEYFRRNNLLEEAYFCAEFYNYNQDEIALKGIPTNDRVNFTVVNESYALSHEVFHYILKERKEMYGAAINAIEDYFKERKLKRDLLAKTDPDGIDTFFASIAPDYLKEESWEKYNEQFELYKKYDINNRIEKYVATSQRLWTEMACDHYASLFSVLNLPRHFGISLLQVLKAVFVGHMHLRWFKQLEFSLDHIKIYPPEDDLKLDDFQRKTMEINFSDENIDLIVRSQYMLQHLIQLHSWIRDGRFPHLKVDLVLTDEQFCEILLKEQDTYYNLFLDPLEKFIGNTMKGGIKKMVNSKIEKQDERYIKMRELANDSHGKLLLAYFIDSETGWQGNVEELFDDRLDTLDEME